MKVLVWDLLPETGELDWIIGYVSQEGVEVSYSRPSPLAAEKRAYALREADALVVLREMVGLEDLKEAGCLRLIQRLSAEAPVDGRVAVTLGAEVRTLAADQFPTAVAEHTLACLLALAKGLYGSHGRRLRENVLAYAPVETDARNYRYNWSCQSPLGLRGRRLGLVGFGRIGRKVAVLAAPLGLEIHYFCRNPLTSEEEGLLGVSFRDLDRLAAESDFVSLHVRYTPETHHLVGKGFLSRMKPGAFLVNTSRGKVVDEEALVHALRAGRLAGAALDVFAVEPLPPDHPLLELENVLLTPHTAAGVLDLSCLGLARSGGWESTTRPTGGSLHGRV